MFGLADIATKAGRDAKAPEISPVALEAVRLAFAHVLILAIGSRRGLRAAIARMGDGFILSAGRCGFRLRRLLIVRPDEAPLDAGLPVVTQHNESATARDGVGIIGLLAGRQPVDLAIQFRQQGLDIGRQFIQPLMGQGQGVLLFLERVQRLLIRWRQVQHRRVLPPQAQGIGEVDVSGVSPLPQQ